MLFIRLNNLHNVILVVIHIQSAAATTIITVNIGCNRKCV